jgi:Fe-S cluster assembly iron-binding protein IscA
LGLALDELENSSDHIIESDDIKILVDDRVSDFLDSLPFLTVNYIETKHGSGYVFEGLKTC